MHLDDLERRLVDPHEDLLAEGALLGAVDEQDGIRPHRRHSDHFDRATWHHANNGRSGHQVFKPHDVELTRNRIDQS
ncbi:hypothetical protein GCM10010532_068870 [Dactylosporangium siamense]|uniref:Uncharacterized protein n=1 Tax=Dactylosporangium siamense TaxID=685454 RepID=A0A919PNB7_9ACTN|nr:hypothetical protein Dsi01nite_048130 [Dactylosporangium siamense]